MIFDILRNKMYSNPILAICREITSNARDAHREVKTPDVPVQITLPTHLEEYYKVKDFGPGISPDRMTNIFIKYTASTKRNDNVQTGGFGLGAKTPFAYSDSFSVVTVVDGIKYDYSCFIDETRVGKMILLHQGPSNEPNGTEIIIPVKAQDFNTFAQGTEQSCRHWDVKPILKGGAVSWQTSKMIIRGKNWAITHSSDWQRNAKMIIDGIEYPLELTTLRTYADAKLIDAARGNFVMYFGVGELSLSASREQIYLDKPTQNKIKARLDDISRELKDQVEKKIDEFPNLWLANIYYRKELNSAFSNLSFLGQLEWKGVPLNDSYIHIGCPAFVYTKGKYSRKHGTDPNKLSRGATQSISFEEDSELYINDLPLKEPTPRHVKKAFDSDPKLKKIQLICPTDKIKLDDLNKAFHLDKMAPKFLSSITKASARAYTAPASRLLIFKFDAGAAAFRQTSYQNFDEDSGRKVICLLSKESVTYSTSHRMAHLENGKKVPLDSLRTLIRKFPDISLYGIDAETPKERIEEDFGDFQSLDEYIEDNIVQNKTINYVQIKFASTHSYSVDSRVVNFKDKFSTLIKDKESLFLKRTALHEMVGAMSKGDMGLLQIYESMKEPITDSQLKEFVKENPDWDIEKINKRFDKKYPLLPVVRESYHYDTLIKHIAQYVNLIDKEEDSNE
jgi:hypothetical protein